MEAESGTKTVAEKAIMAMGPAGLYPGGCMALIEIPVFAVDRFFYRADGACDAALGNLGA